MRYSKLFRVFNCLFLINYVTVCYTFNFLPRFMSLTSSLLRTSKILNIADDSNPELRLTSQKVPEDELNSDLIRYLVDDMIATMNSARGIGLAAPQILIRKRIIIFSLPADRDEFNPQGVPLTALVNPEVVSISDDTPIVDYEGCLSVPDKRGKVSRPSKIIYKGYDPINKSYIEREAIRWHARVFLHELDHLNGILYPDVMSQKDRIMTVDEWRAETNRLQ